MKRLKTDKAPVLRRLFQWGLALCAAVLLVAAPCAEAKNKNKGNDASHAGKKSDSGKGGADKGTVTLPGLASAGISFRDARKLAEEYKLTGYSNLPPGIRKNLARGKPLPPGIAKKMVPGNMLSRLPVHPGYDWRVAGADLILVSATGVVADVLSEVFK